MFLLIARVDWDLHKIFSLFDGWPRNDVGGLG